MDTRRREGKAWEIVLAEEAATMTQDRLVGVYSLIECVRDSCHPLDPLLMVSLDIGVFRAYRNHVTFWDRLKYCNVIEGVVMHAEGVSITFL